MRALAAVALVALAAASTTRVQAEDLWPQVKDLLEQRCVECHGPKKTKASLRLDSPAGIRLGGNNGVVLVAGQPEASPLLTRTLLADDSDDLMPPKGGRLTREQTGLIKRWIMDGAAMPGAAAPVAPANTAAGAPVPAAAKAARPFHAPDDEIDLAGSAMAEPPAPALQALRDRGVFVRSIDRKGRALEVVVRHASPPFADADLALLAPLAANLVWVDLGGSVIGDAGTAVLAGGAQIRRLRLDGTSVGDATVARIASLPALTSLNLVATKVTDAGLRNLAQARSLRRLALWKTATTADAGDRLERSIPGLEISRGSN